MAEKTDKFVPPKKSLTLEFWVGIFALAGVGCFAYLALNIARMRITNAGYYDVKATFDNVAGLKVGAPVEIAGVQVGEISTISLKETEAVIVMRIKDGTKLRDDDIAAIRTKGIIGDRYIKVVPGSSSKILGRDGSMGQTESAVEFEEIIGKLIHRMEG